MNQKINLMAFRASTVACLAGAALALTPALAQSGPAGMQQMLERADANKDGAVTRTELIDSRVNTFERLDRNEDGVVSSKDRPRLGGGRFDTAVSRLSAQFDANEDGELTRAEFVDGPTTGFDAGDVNGDDILSADEIANLPPATTQ